MLFKPLQLTIILLKKTEENLKLIDVLLIV